MYVPFEIDVETYDFCFMNARGVDLGLDDASEVLSEQFELGPGHAGLYTGSVFASRLMKLVGDKALSEF